MTTENRLLVRQENNAATLKLASGEELEPRLAGWFVWNNLIEAKLDSLNLAQGLPSKVKDIALQKAPN